MADDDEGDVPPGHLVRIEDLRMTGADTPLCFAANAAQARDWVQFADDVAALSARIRGTAHICNLFEDRYDFMVGLAAAVLNGQRTILPAARAPGAVSAALRDVDAACLLGQTHATDSFADHVPDLPKGGRGEPAELPARLIAAAGDIAVFTSGSTGRPVRHLKTWAGLSGGAQITDALFAHAGLEGARFAIVGTTPHQHMYGLEAAVFTGLAQRRCLYRGTVFFPEDLSTVAAAAERAGYDALALVTSPAHLKFFEPALSDLAMFRMILSATAPLPPALAERLEARANPPAVFEIYGSTESGTLAWRRTVTDADWTLAEGVSITPDDPAPIADAPHLAAPVPLGDAVEITATGHLRLLGRLGDMIHVAGKRTSLGALNAILLEDRDLQDGIVLRERTEGDDILTIAAVRREADPLTPQRRRAAIRRHMAAHTDPVFVPRRIEFIAELPRNATGKVEEKTRLTILHALATGQQQKE